MTSTFSPAATISPSKESILKIDQCPIKGLHYIEHFTGENDTSSKSNHSKGSFTRMKLMLFDVCARPIGGLTNDEIEHIVQFVLQSNMILYYAMGVELVSQLSLEQDPDTGLDIERVIETQHLHIRVVMNSMCYFNQVRDMFRRLLSEKRLAPYPKHSMYVGKPNRHETKSLTPMLHCKYALKEAAKNKTANQIGPRDWNNKVTTWTNLFDERTPEKKDWWKWKEERFAHLLFKEYHKKHKSTLAITETFANEMSQKYAKARGLAWSFASRPAIIARMCTDKSGNEYVLAPTFKLKKKKAAWLKSLRNLKGTAEEFRYCYRTELQKALEEHYKSIDGSSTIIHTHNNKELNKQLEDKTNQCGELESLCNKLKKEADEKNEEVDALVAQYYVVQSQYNALIQRSNKCINRLKHLGDQNWLNHNADELDVTCVATCNKKRKRTESNEYDSELFNEYDSVLVSVHP